MTICLKTISEHTGISVSTISNILSGRRSRYSSSTRSRVLTVARELGYQPNMVARALATGKTHRIGYYSYLMNWRTILQLGFSLQKLVLPEQYHVLFGEFETSEDGGYQIDLPSVKELDGVMLLTGGCPVSYAGILDEARRSKLPVVQVIDRNDVGIDFVDIDLYDATCEAIEAMIRQGRRRIVYVAYEYMLSESRYRAYVATMEGHGLIPEVLPLPSDPSQMTFQRFGAFAREYLDGRGCPEGIFCVTDEVAIGVYRALDDRGYRVPQDALLTGVGGIEELQYFGNRIGSIEIPFHQIVSCGWWFLKNRMENGQIGQQTMVFKGRHVSGQRA